MGSLLARRYPPKQTGMERAGTCCQHGMDELAPFYSRTRPERLFRRRHSEDNRRKCSTRGAGSMAGIVPAPMSGSRLPCTLQAWTSASWNVNGMVAKEGAMCFSQDSCGHVRFVAMGLQCENTTGPFVPSVCTHITPRVILPQVSLLKTAQERKTHERGNHKHPLPTDPGG